MDSAAGHRMAPDPTAVAVKLESELAEALPAWVLPAVMFARWRADEAWTKGLVPPEPSGSGVPLSRREEPAWDELAPLPRLEPRSWQERRLVELPVSGERAVAAEIPLALLRPVPRDGALHWEEPAPPLFPSLRGEAPASPPPPASRQRQRCRHCSGPARLPQ